MKRYCIVCGKELDIVLELQPDGKTYNIISGGFYFSFGEEDDEFIFKHQGIGFEPKTIDEQREMWECCECAGEDDEDEGISE